MIGIGIQLANSYDIDIKVTKDAQGRIVSGLVVGNILAQNQAIILQLHKGELKDNPSVGVGITDMLLDHNPLAWRTAIQEQLERDGQKVDSVKINSAGGIEIVASY